MTADTVTTAGEETAAVKANTKGAFTWGLGRRKSSIARVRVKPGTGNFLVNGKPFDEFFCTLQGRLRAKAPLVTAESEGAYDVFCNVKGGGGCKTRGDPFAPFALHSSTLLIRVL